MIASADHRVQAILNDIDLTAEQMLARFERGPAKVWWEQDRNCRGMNTDEVFYPKRGDVTAMANARAICSGCPSRIDCLVQSLVDHESCGVFGGLSERQRRHLRRFIADTQRRRDAEMAPETVAA